MTRREDFRLATLERLREQRMQACALSLRAANQELAQARELRESLEAQLRRGMPPATTSADQLAQGATYREVLREQLRGAAAAIDGLAAVLAGRRQDWVTASAQLRAVTALHARHRLALARAVDRREQLDLDELAGTRATNRAINRAAAGEQATTSGGLS